MPRLGWPEIVIILVVVMIVFGVGKLPQVGGAIGKGLRSFRKAQKGEDIDEEVVDEEEEKPRKRVASKAAKGGTKA